MAAEITPGSEFLFVVSDVFNLTGRGLVIASGPNAEISRFHNGDRVVLRRPDGSIIENGAFLEMMTPNEQNIIAFSLPGLSKSEVPIGTEVWIGRRSSKPEEVPELQVHESRHSGRYAESATGKSRVLVAEPDARLAESIACALQEQGCKVETSTNGPEALQRIESGGFDLILLDLALPTQSGADLCEIVRRSSGSIPIVVLTPPNSPPELVSGVDDYVAKPFSIDELTARVRAVLRRASL